MTDICEKSTFLSGGPKSCDFYFPFWGIIQFKLFSFGEFMWVLVNFCLFLKIIKKGSEWGLIKKIVIIVPKKCRIRLTFKKNCLFFSFKIKPNFKKKIVRIFFFRTRPIFKMKKILPFKEIVWKKTCLERTFFKGTIWLEQQDSDFPKIKNM